MARHDDIVILIALGANVPGPAGEPRASLEEAVRRMRGAGIRVERVSPFVVTPAFPLSDQPDFVNGVLDARSALAPADLLARLHEIEHQLGRLRCDQPSRVRLDRWDPRPIDLDLLAYGETVSANYWIAAARGDVPGSPGRIVLPHPRLHLRRFVLEPLAAIVPHWRHPALGLTAAELLARLPAE